MTENSNERFWVRLCKENLVFSAAHFITFNGDVCERLHGHNYRVAVSVAAPLDENQYVIDFIALRDALQKLVGELDHHMLLPDSHPLIKVESSAGEIEVRFRERRWVFPADDCVILPVANTTAELLARYLGLKLLDAITTQTSCAVERLKVEVDENLGQWGGWEWQRPR